MSECFCGAKQLWVGTSFLAWNLLLVGLGFRVEGFRIKGLGLSVQANHDRYG